MGRVRISELKDSKKLSESKRSEIAQEIKKAKSISIGVVSSKMIDKINIKRASILAMQKAAINLSCRPKKIIVDGVDAFESEFPLISMIKADNFIPEVMAASIIAKVYRDELLKKLDKKVSRILFLVSQRLSNKKTYRSY